MKITPASLMTSTPLKIIATCFALSLGTLPAAPVWDGNGAPNSSGNWNTAANWNPDAIPVTNDAVTLGDVTAGTRTVTFNASSLTLQSLTLTQTTAGASNILAIPYQSPTPQTLTVTNAMTLGTAAAGSTAGITITGPSAASTTPALNAAGGLTVGTGGVLSFQFDPTTPVGYTGYAGNLTVNTGGSVVVAAPSGSNTLFLAIGTNAANGLANAGTFTLGGGTLRLENTSTASARLSIAENFTWNSGKIQLASSTSSNNGAQYLILHGLTNTIGASAVFERVNTGGTTTAAPDLYMRIADTGSAPTSTQTLSSAVTLGNVNLYENSSQQNLNTMTHVISSTAVGTGIGQVTMTSYGVTNVFQLGSNLTSTNTSASFITSSGNQGGTNARVFRVDLNGNTFDGTASANGWTPNRMLNGASAVAANQTWNLTSTVAGGVLKATKFDFSLSGALAGDALSVGSGVILNATGGAGSANVLTGSTATYTFNANSTFRYSGAATSANAATLTSSVAIGGLEVQNGALKIAQASLSTGGNVTISSNGTLDLNGATAGTLVLGTSKNFSSTNGTLLLTVGTALDTITGSGLGTFSLTNTAIVLNLGTGFSYGSAYAIFTGFDSGTVSNVVFSGYDTTNYTALLGTNGTLSFNAIPEPGTGSALLFGLGMLSFLRRKKIGKLSLK